MNMGKKYVTDTVFEVINLDTGTGNKLIIREDVDFEYLVSVKKMKEGNIISDLLLDIEEARELVIALSSLANKLEERKLIEDVKSV